MVKLLLDTATFLWLASDEGKLSPSARAAYDSPDNELYLSVVSLWEIITKVRANRLPLPVSVDALVEPLRESASVSIIPLTEGAVMRLQTLPDIPNHKDPFDRMLVCQAAELELTVLTPDAKIREYSIIKTMW